VLLVGSAVLAFVVAAVKQGRTTNGAVHGVLAAVGAYLLVLPLVLMASAGRDVAQISMTAAAAVLVGALAGWVESRRHTRKARGRTA
jgi:branched-subunit amino acid ABC-type transport system permease component